MNLASMTNGTPLLVAIQFCLGRDNGSGTAQVVGMFWYLDDALLGLKGSLEVGWSMVSTSSTRQRSMNEVGMKGMKHPLIIGLDHSVEEIEWSILWCNKFYFFYTETHLLVYFSHYTVSRELLLVHERNPYLMV